MAKLVGTGQWCLVIRGAIPPGATEEQAKIIIMQAVSISTAVMAQVQELSCTTDQNVIQAIASRLQQSGPKLV